MQSVPFSGSSSGESERPPSPAAPVAAEGFTITPKTATILKEHMVDFQKADTETRNRILETVMGEIYALLPPNSAFDKKEAKLVFVLVLYELHY